MYFGYFLGPEHIQKTTFASMNQYFNDKSIIFLTKVNFDNRSLLGNKCIGIFNGFKSPVFVTNIEFVLLYDYKDMNSSCKKW